MRRLCSLFLALMVLAFVAPHLQARTTEMDESLVRQAEQAPKRGFYWEARKGEKKIYLAGTVHVGREDFFPPNIEYLRRISEAEAIVVEADVSDAARVGAVVQKMAVYRPGEPGLDTRIGEALKNRIVALAKRFQLEPDRLWRTKPWMVANTLVIVQATAGGFSPAYATESFLMQYARGTGKPLLEVESIDLQLSIFERADQETQIAYLEQAVRGIESGDAEREVRKIVEAWDRRDAQAAERLIGDIHKAKNKGERFVADQLFDGRHARMVEAIEKYTDSGTLHFVAVGALHYFGPRGLLAILRSRGYTITQIE